MQLWELNHVKRLFETLKGSLMGVGINGFSRIMASRFVPSYEIICLRNTKDLSTLRMACPVFCLEQQLEKALPKYKTSLDILGHLATRNYLGSCRRPIHLLLYQNYPGLMELSQEEKWCLIANPPLLRMRLANREYFHQMARKLGLRTIPGGTYPLKYLFNRDYEYWKERLGPCFVCQLPEIQLGGGKGTFYIGSVADYELLKVRLASRIWRNTRLSKICIHQYIEGASASIALCVTRHGILKGPVQIQLVDLPYCHDLEEKGIFCGHYWPAKLWSKAQEKEAVESAMRVARYVSAMGYKGILGIDFIMDRGGKACFVQELNPRFTGAFPFLSMLHLEMGAIPIEVFHILEFLNIQYEIDVPGLNEAYDVKLDGGHIIIFALDGLSKQTIGLRSGVYEVDLKGAEMKHIGEGLDYSAIRSSSQIVIAGGPPYGLPEQENRDPLFRVCHVMFRKGLIPSEQNILETINGLAKLVYRTAFQHSM